MLVRQLIVLVIIASLEKDKNNKLLCVFFFVSGVSDRDHHFKIINFASFLYILITIVVKFIV